MPFRIVAGVVILVSVMLGFVMPGFPLLLGVLELGVWVFFPLTIIAAFSSGWASMKGRRVGWIRSLVRILVLMTVAMVSAVALDKVAGVVTVRAALPTEPGIR